MFDKQVAALKAAVKNALASSGLQSDSARTAGQTVNYLSATTVNPAVLARAFAQADLGIITDQANLFRLVEEQDTHVFSELSKRRRAVTSLAWRITPHRDANQADLDQIGELTDMVNGIENIADALYDLTDGIGKGLAALEIDWRLGDTWTPRQLTFVDSAFLQIDRPTGEFRYLNLGIPEPLRPNGWIIHEHRGKSGYIQQSALFRVLCWAYAYKSYNSRDMQRFLEMYGLPLRLGKYPDGIGKPQRDELLKAVRNIGNDGAGIVPTSMAIDFVEAKIGKVGDFLSAIEYWERKQSLAILGGTLTSQADGRTSTYALGAIHNEVRKEIKLHDVKQLEPTITRQLLQPIIQFNGMFKTGRNPCFGFDTEEAIDQEAFMVVLEKAVDLGFEVNIDWAHKAAQIPRGEKGTTMLGSPTAAKANAALTRLVALAAKQGPTISDAYSQQLADLCVKHEAALIDAISLAVQGAEDFDSALAAIAELSYKAVDPAWADDVSLGLLAAHLAGRA